MEKFLKRSMSYSEYRRLIQQLAEAGDTTGLEKNDSRINYTKLNRQRMARLERTVALNETAKLAAALNKRPMIWLVITESWCGDAAQNIPVIEKIAAESDIIDTRYLLRDENLELMDRFLENGSQSIPKLIALDRENLEVLGAWGSRPAALKKYFLQLKEQALEKSEISELLQRWYNVDKDRSLQNDFGELLPIWGARMSAAVGALV